MESAPLGDDLLDGLRHILRERDRVLQTPETLSPRACVFDGRWSGASGFLVVWRLKHYYRTSGLAVRRILRGAMARVGNNTVHLMVFRWADDRFISSASAPRRRQTTKGDGLPHQSQQYCR